MGRAVSDKCIHIEGTWPILGKPVKYTAHITAARGRDRTQEVIDDIHIELDHASMTERIVAYITQPGVYDAVARTIVEGEVLTKYAMRGLKPQPPE